MRYGLVIGPCLLIAVAFGLSGCEQSSSAEGVDDGVLRGKLTLTGSSTVAPLVGEIAKRFEQRHPEVRVDVQTGGSSRGIADTHSGLADIGMSSRSLKLGEQAGVTTHILAQDGVAFVINAANPVASLTNQQLHDIYTGKITRWSEVGDRDAPITVINRAEGRSELELVTKFFEIKPSDIQPTLVAGENQECVKLVAGNPDAIAYLSVGTAEYESQRGTPLKLLPFAGVEANTTTVKAGTFPLGRPLVLITKNGRSPLVDAFIEFALTPAVDDLIEGQSFVSPR
ncbi:MAG: phosphate ABC transporter substrate-binding protein [Planctomycetota bacterium]